MADRIKAARVVKEVNAYALTGITGRWRHLAELHSAPRWLWSALVDEAMTVPIVI
jgi:hypothetical protein